MGSPTIANMVMEYVEEKVLSTFLSRPILWKRYVDNTFTVLPESFLEHLNKVEPSIRFTVKKEVNDQLPFLDLLISRDSDGPQYIENQHILTNIYIFSCIT